MSPPQASALAELKQRLESQGLVRYAAPGVLESGLRALDARVGGWPCPGVAEISGAPGAGRLGPLLPALERESQAGRPVAVVDVLERLHPPGLPRVCWPRLLLLRPGPERAHWATEQLLRSGALILTVLLDPAPVRRAGYRLLRAAEQGRSALVVVSEAPDAGLPASLRMAVAGWRAGRQRLRLLRARGLRGGERLIEI